MSTELFPLSNAIVYDMFMKSLMVKTQYKSLPYIVSHIALIFLISINCSSTV